MPVFADLSLVEWTAVAALGLVFAFTSRIIYYLFLHPLSDVPGPFLGRVSGIPSWYHAVRGNRHIWLWQQFEVYGSRVRITPNTVLFRGPTAYFDIYNPKANVQKSAFYEATQKDKHSTNTLTTRDRTRHAARRRILNNCFTERTIRAAETPIIAHIDRWNELLIPDDVHENEWSKPIDFGHAMDPLSFDIMGEFVFGSSFNSKEPGDSPFMEVMLAGREYLKFLYPIGRSPMVHLLLWIKPRFLDALFDKLMPPNIRLFDDFVTNSVAKRVEQFKSQKYDGDQAKDMLWFLCDAKDDDGRPAYTPQQLCAEASLLIIAGSDTASVVLGSFMFYITRNRAAYQKLVSEIRTTFASPEQIVHGAALASCVYLKACIDEALRLGTPGPSELSREVLKGGAMIDGHFYPEGTIVGNPRWAQYHNDEFWGDAEVFRPERWIPDEATAVTQEDVNMLKTNFQPFAYGPGNCPGKNIALLELSVTIARTMHRFDVRKSLEGDCNLGAGVATDRWEKRNKNVWQVEDAYITIHKGPVVQFKRRRA